MESVQLKTLCVTNLNINPVFSVSDATKTRSYKFWQDPAIIIIIQSLLKFPRFSLSAQSVQLARSQFPRYLGDSELGACVMVTAHLPTDTLSNMRPSLTIQRRHKAKVRWFLLVNLIKILLSSFLLEKACPNY